MDYIVSDTKEGSKTLIIKSDGANRDIKLHSAYDPVKEAQRSVESFNAGKCSIIAVSGIALGYHISSLKKKYPALQIIAIENETAVTELCRKHNPSSLDGILVIHSENDLSIFFENLNLSEFRGVSHYIHRPSYQLNSAFYDSILANMKTYISSRVSDLLTRFEFEEKWVKNIFTNLRWLGRAPGVSSFFNSFNGYPGIIISAGPSLREELEILKELRDKAVIICVDTAFKVLSKAGIEPHFVMTLDAQKYSFKHFTGVLPADTVLISDMVSCPSILNYYRGRKVLSTTSKFYQNPTGKTIRETTPSMDWIEQYADSPGDIQSGGSVATSAFDFLLNIGCNPIILLGQDLAYTGREIHCSGTYHNDDWMPQINRLKNLDSINQNVIRKRKIKYVTRFNGNGRVISDFVFDLYKSWFEDSASIVNVKVINSNSGGARIAGTTEISSQELNLKTQTESPSALIDRILHVAKPATLDILTQKITEVQKKIKNIINIAESGRNDDEKYSEIDRILDEPDVNSLLKPLMRKTDFYTSRHIIDSSKIQVMMYNEIRNSSLKISSFIEKFLKLNSDY